MFFYSCYNLHISFFINLLSLFSPSLFFFLLPYYFFFNFSPLISFIYNCFYISDVDTSPDKVRVVARERAIHPDMYHQQIGYSNKNETCILYPKLPKAWLANGFVIIPSLSEKGEVTFIYLY